MAKGAQRVDPGRAPGRDAGGGDGHEEQQEADDREHDGIESADAEEQVAEQAAEGEREYAAAAKRAVRKPRARGAAAESSTTSSILRMR